MAIYTKKGDRGETSIFSRKERLSKSSPRIKTIGAVDEVNSFIGIILVEDPKLKELKEVQRNLFTVGAILAGAPLRFPSSKTKVLEKRIDKIEGSLPVLKNFILPGGGKTAANLFFARTLARRAERYLVALNLKEEVKPEILVFVNRLSDYLFMLAREVNFRQGVKDEVWKGKRK
ncbi:ATP:cob(I)alamin adenosyltransferase [Candidatus Woesebacteria bacterium RIFCSPHIGHO2_12_FULL_46_16]|uniref:Corrinoid adenosyltransferase n=1 Tax=Candidatus Woesebacteria bacterium RIFCSPHIGHO2_12_FULL_46_16 TaxID=1802513 RepID=A0A1F8B1H2_9BACT|nr:MAG: ATP:cob(I)alamin adenosyltransferase [Candidatus Woesebacteria bacterium RIFCSPHIGHO2_12_FULL_46_16]